MQCIEVLGRGVGDVRHPMQPLVLDAEGVVRFKDNSIVRYMLEAGRIGGRFDLNSIVGWCGDFSQEDLEQFYQLIGYSVSDYGGLSFIRPETANTCDNAAQDFYAEARSTPECRALLEALEAW